MRVAALFTVLAVLTAEISDCLAFLFEFLLISLFCGAYVTRLFFGEPSTKSRSQFLIDYCDFLSTGGFKIALDAEAFLLLTDDCLPVVGYLIIVMGAATLPSYLTSLFLSGLVLNTFSLCALYSFYF